VPHVTRKLVAARRRGDAPYQQVGGLSMTHSASHDATQPPLLAPPTAPAAAACPVTGAVAGGARSRRAAPQHAKVGAATTRPPRSSVTPAAAALPLASPHAARQPRAATLAEPACTAARLRSAPAAAASRSRAGCKAARTKARATNDARAACSSSLPATHALVGGRRQLLTLFNTRRAGVLCARQAARRRRQRAHRLLPAGASSAWAARLRTRCTLGARPRKFRREAAAV
jgi:hypothetical protein